MPVAIGARACGTRLRGGVLVYGLADPREPERVRYVGKTVDPQERLWHHVYTAQAGKQTHKDRWVRTLLEAGVRPLMVELEWATGDTWQECERRWVAGFDRSDLTNITAGGDGVDAPRTEQWRQRIGAAHKGKEIPDAARESIREALLASHPTCRHGHPWTAENTGTGVKDGRPYRVCRTCAREYSEAQRRAAGVPPREDAARLRLKEFCRRGHPLSGENLRILARGDRTERICRECVRIRNRACDERARAAATGGAA